MIIDRGGVTLLTIECSKNYRDIEEIWEGLCEQSSEWTVYQNPVYMRLLWKHLLPYRVILRIRPMFYVFKENGQPIMILPLFKYLLKENYVLYGYKAGCGYLNAIYRDDLTIEQMQQCFNLLENQTNIKQIKFVHVKCESILGKYLLQNGAMISETPCISIHLPECYDEYYSCLSKSMRQNLRTAYNRLNKDGKNVQLFRYKNNEIPKELRESLLQLYIKRQIHHYKRAGGGLYKLFVKWIDMGTIIQKELDGWEDVFILKIDNEVAAYFDALYSMDEYTVPRLAINEYFSKYSPGVLLLNESIKQIIESSKVRTIDLTHGGEKYKVAMGGSEKYCVELIVRIDRAKVSDAKERE